MIGKILHCAFSDRPYSDLWEEVKENPWSSLGSTALDVGLIGVNFVTFGVAAPALAVRCAVTAGEILTAVRTTTVVAEAVYVASEYLTTRKQWLDMVQRIAARADKDADFMADFLEICNSSLKPEKYAEVSAGLRAQSAEKVKEILKAMIRYFDTQDTDEPCKEEVLEFINDSLNMGTPKC